MSAIGFSLGEAAASLWRRRASNALSILTITVALFMLGVFLLVNVNAQRWIDRWTDAAEVSVYLADGATADASAAVRQALAVHPLVAGQEFVSSEEASRRFARLFPELAQASAALGPAALPASFEVRLRPSEGAGEEAVDQLASVLRRLPGVSDVRYDRRFLARLEAVVRAGRFAGLALAALLILAAALTVASVVRLALHARRQEVEIMHLVGAPLAYIRGPFVLEGVLQGGLGALLASALLYAGYTAARMRADAIAGLWPGASAEALVFLPAAWLAGLLGGGMLVGCLGGFIAARRTRADPGAR